jgi:hypothetical protein
MTKDACTPFGGRKHVYPVRRPLYLFVKDLFETMGKVEQIEGEVRSLSSDELRTVRDWFTRYDAEIWDRQIEADSKAGKLRALADRALADHQQGRSTIL